MRYIYYKNFHKQFLDIYSKIIRMNRLNKQFIIAIIKIFVKKFRDNAKSLARYHIACTGAPSIDG